LRRSSSGSIERMLSSVMGRIGSALRFMMPHLDTGGLTPDWLSNADSSIAKGFSRAHRSSVAKLKSGLFSALQ
jgi:hypothetical protein